MEDSTTANPTMVSADGTATPGIPNTGNFDQSGTPVVNDQGQVSGTVVGTMEPFQPQTGEFSMDTTPGPLGPSVLSPDGVVNPYASTPFPGLGTSAAGTPAAVNDDIHGDDDFSGTGVPNTGSAEVLVRLTQLMNGSFGSMGTNLGQVTDFVINIPQARISYVVVNGNNRSILVPWSQVSLSDDQGFGFTGTVDQFNSAPLLDLNATDFNNQKWDQSFQQFWGSHSDSDTSSDDSSHSDDSGKMSGTQTASNSGTGVSLSAGPSAILASQLMRIQVVAPGFNIPSGTAVPNTGTNLGQVQDALVSQKSGSVPWLLVSVSSNFVNLNNRVIPVPFPALGSLKVNGLFLALDQNLLSSAPNLDASNLPDLFGSGWDQQFFQFWNNSKFNVSGTAQP